MDKHLSKKLFIKNKILTPKYILYSFNKSKSNLVKLIEKKLKFPIVIKPINEGSSVNVFICSKKYNKNIKKLEIYKRILLSNLYQEEKFKQL